MLVLSRKKNESIIVDDSIRIVIVEVRGDKVRVGIQASTDIPIFREEIWLERQAKKEEVTGE